MLGRPAPPERSTEWWVRYRAVVAARIDQDPGWVVGPDCLAMAEAVLERRRAHV